MRSANTDPELRQWLSWASETGTTPMFVSKVADAASAACIPDYEQLRPVLLELKRQHPQPPPGWSALKVAFSDGRQKLTSSTPAFGAWSANQSLSVTAT
jgi:hypothetical protein